MGRLYSGNLNAYRDAVERLHEDHDVRVEEESYRYRDEMRRRDVCGKGLRVVTRSGAVLTAKGFEQDDIDVRYNAMTEWLRKVHGDLKHWK